MSRAEPWLAVGAAAFVVAGFLLLSMGGAVVAAPVTVPMMYVAARRRPTRRFRTAATVLSALTVGEVVWAVTYLTLDEAQPWIWLLPSVGALALVVVFQRLAPASPAPPVP